MALGITAALAGTGNRAVAIEVTGATAGVRFTVRRQVSYDGGTSWFDSGGEPRFYVRGMINRLPADGTTCYDVDFPQGATIKYTVVQDATSATSSAVGPIDLGADMLIGLGSTTLHAPVIPETVPDLARPAPGVVMKPVGRRDPVSVGDNRQYPTFTLDVWALAGEQTVRDILDRYPVVVFSPRDPRHIGSAVAMYVAVRAVTEQAIRSTLAYRRFSIECSQVGAPANPAVTTLGSDWGDDPVLEA